MEPLRELSLFSGYGGFSLGLRIAGINSRTIGWCDNDKYVQKIIKARIEDGYLDDAPIISDIRSFNWELYRGLVDIITAGFPCQPHSHAGKRDGEADERNLWPDTRRCISEVRPRYVLLENVPGIISNGYIRTVTSELSQLGYDSTWGIVSAKATGAPHLRKRWWCLAWLADSISKRGCSRNSRGEYAEDAGQPSRCEEPGWWDIEPNVGRVAHGVTSRVDRLKACGNGIVPAVVAKFLWQIEEE